MLELHKKQKEDLIKVTLAALNENNNYFNTPNITEDKLKNNNIVRFDFEKMSARYEDKGLFNISDNELSSNAEEFFKTQENHTISIEYGTFEINTIKPLSIKKTTDEMELYIYELSDCDDYEDNLKDINETENRIDEIKALLEFGIHC